jgi:hypothetical protein
MGKPLQFLLLLNLAWLPQASAYIQNGFANGNQFGPTQPYEQNIPPEEETPEVTNPTPPEVTTPIITPPIPRPYEARPKPVKPKYEFLVKATTRALGINYAESQPATQLTSCGVLRFGVDNKCNPVNVAKDFVNPLLEQIPKCVNKALKLDGKAPAANIFVEHMGTYQDRNVADSKELSLHATGRAIDIAKFIITTVTGERIIHSMTIASKDHPFYNNFNACWKTYQGKSASCHPKGGGMIDWHDEDHHDHVHLSLPFCPKHSGVAGY